MGLILTGSIKRFTNEGDLQGKYHRISNKGINYLRNKGHDLAYNAEGLQVSDTFFSSRFEKLVEYNGQEYYLVNMLDHNLTNLQHVKNFINERAKNDGRKVLLLTGSLANYRSIPKH